MFITALISFNAFHCSFGALIFVAVWIVRCIWLVQTIKSGIFSLINEIILKNNLFLKVIYHWPYIVPRLLHTKTKFSFHILEFLELNLPICRLVIMVDHHQYADVDLILILHAKIFEIRKTNFPIEIYSC